MPVAFAEPLQAWAAAIFVRCGASADAATDTARLLVRTSLRGIDTHGIARLPQYAGKLQGDAYRAQALPVIREQHGALQCDGDGGLGQHVALLALRAAMKRADSQSLVGCTLRGCGHLGALGTIAVEAAEQGMVAVLCQRTPPIMGLPGFRGRGIGNNPLAFAMPVPNGVPLVFDTALSVVARGRVADAARDGLPCIPEGWAVDLQGQPTTDVQAALGGAMLPMAGHKGMGLAMLVECLAGSLAASSGDATGAFLLVANPKLAPGQATFDESVGQWLGQYRQAAGSGGRYPGERQAKSEQERRADGIPLPPALLRNLRALGDKLGLAFPC